MNKAHFLTGLALLMFIIILGLAGTEDAKVEEVETVNYCENVSSGAWPDFNNNYERVCKHGH